jgi:hypothetical protein
VVRTERFFPDRQRAFKESRSLRVLALVSARWRERAEEARSIAEQLNEPESSRMLLRIAEDYERLAKHAERRAQKRAEGVEEDAPLAIGMAHL